VSLYSLSNSPNQSIASSKSPEVWVISSLNIPKVYQMDEMEPYYLNRNLLKSFS
jgi:hypothetical protein